MRAFISMLRRKAETETSRKRSVIVSRLWMDSRLSQVAYIPPVRVETTSETM